MLSIELITADGLLFTATETFPEIHAEFVQGRFVVKQKHRSGSGIPIDMALEKVYNKPAKKPGGVIGFSSRKEAVAQWNLIKHEKTQYTKFLQELCLLNDDREYSRHHEFSRAIAQADERVIEQITSYISERQNPFDFSIHKQLTNLVTGNEVDKETTNYLLNCITTRKRAYSDFKTTRLQDKSEKLFDPIRKSFKKEQSPSNTKKS